MSIFSCMFGRFYYSTLYCFCKDLFKKMSVKIFGRTIDVLHFSMFFYSFRKALLFVYSNKKNSQICPAGKFGCFIFERGADIVTDADIANPRLCPAVFCAHIIYFRAPLFR